MTYKEKLNAAINPNASREVLKKLAMDMYWIVRMAVAGNHNTPEETLKKMLRDSDLLVRNEAERNLAWMTCGNK